MTHYFDSDDIDEIEFFITMFNLNISPEEILRKRRENKRKQFETKDNALTEKQTH